MKTNEDGLRLPEIPEEVPDWLDEMLLWAREQEATDLHFMPSLDEARLWVRIDGVLRSVAEYDLETHRRTIMRLKVMGRCTDYQGELVMEGSFRLGPEGEDSDEARLSIVQTLSGEKAALRLLVSKHSLHTISGLGYPDELKQILQSTMDGPQGLLLAVGPSGCGKSTALYALLRDLIARQSHPLSVVTIEDPIEQYLPDAVQVAVEPDRGLGFAEALRAILRQDVEVIMVGEIRDAETAETALQSALTGHRMLSSMHTLTAAEALVRLRQMGAPAYVVASALQGVLNVRLVRLLCEECHKTVEMNADQKQLLPESTEWESQKLAEPEKCPACLQTGYRGRTGIAEWMLSTEETAKALRENRSAKALEETLQTVFSARQAALELLRDHRISLAEWQAQAGFYLNFQSSEK